jgi:hypothetical protein
VNREIQMLALKVDAMVGCHDAHVRAGMQPCKLRKLWDKPK